jgi:hypothetical protein
MGLIKHIVDPGEWIHVFDGDFIQSMIVNTHPLCAVFLMDKITGAPHGDELGWIYPFPSSYWIWSLSSLNCRVDILYGILYIGAVPGSNSIMNSKSRSGGIPDSSSREMLGYSFTSCMSWLYSACSQFSLIWLVVPLCVMSGCATYSTSYPTSVVSFTDFFEQSMRDFFLLIQSIPRITSIPMEPRTIKLTMSSIPP